MCQGPGIAPSAQTAATMACPRATASRSSVSLGASRCAASTMRQAAAIEGAATALAPL